MAGVNIISNNLNYAADRAAASADIGFNLDFAGTRIEQAKAYAAGHSGSKDKNKGNSIINFANVSNNQGNDSVFSASALAVAPRRGRGMLPQGERINLPMVSNKSKTTQGTPSEVSANTASWESYNAASRNISEASKTVSNTYSNLLDTNLMLNTIRSLMDQAAQSNDTGFLQQIQSQIDTVLGTINQSGAGNSQAFASAAARSASETEQLMPNQGAAPAAGQPQGMGVGKGIGLGKGVRYAQDVAATAATQSTKTNSSDMNGNQAIEWYYDILREGLQLLKGMNQEYKTMVADNDAGKPVNISDVADLAKRIQDTNKIVFDTFTSFIKFTNTVLIDNMTAGTPGFNYNQFNTDAFWFEWNVRTFFTFNPAQAQSNYETGPTNFTQNAIDEANKPGGSVTNALSQIDKAFKGEYGDVGIFGNDTATGGLFGLIGMIIDSGESFLKPGKNDPDIIFSKPPPDNIGGNPYKPPELELQTPGKKPEQEKEDNKEKEDNPETGSVVTPPTTGDSGTSRPPAIVVEMPNRVTDSGAFFQVGVNKQDNWNFSAAQINATNLGLADKSGNSLINVVNSSPEQTAANYQRIDNAISFVLAERAQTERVGARLSADSQTLAYNRETRHPVAPWRDTIERISNMDKATSDRMVRINFLQQMSSNLLSPLDAMLQQPNMQESQNQSQNQSLKLAPNKGLNQDKPQASGGAMASQANAMPKQPKDPANQTLM
jgi:hypothetical protein